jgi:hypothetical protein
VVDRGSGFKPAALSMFSAAVRPTEDPGWVGLGKRSRERMVRHRATERLSKGALRKD